MISIHRYFDRGTFWRAAGLATIALSASCTVDTSTENVGSTEDELFFRSTTVKWPGMIVPVCFRPDFTQAQMNTIKTNVEEQWNRVSGIVFGFTGACPTTIGSDMLVVRVDPAISPEFGQTTVGKNSVNVVKFVSGSPSVHTILHEFGHALGFRHEHNEGTCDTRTTDQLVSPEADVATSIMSRSGCNDVTRLSPNDIVGVQRVYGRKHVGALPGLGAKCVQISGHSNVSGTGVVATDCTAVQSAVWFDNSIRQLQTTILHTGTGGSVTTLCARYRNALSPTTSTPIVSGSCSGAPAFDFLDQQLKTFSGLCVMPTTSDIGATLVTRNCSRGTSALWNFQDVGSSQKRLVHSATGLCIEIGSAQLGDTPTLQLCSTSTRQRFNFNNGLIVPAGQSAVCFNVFTGLARTGLTVGLWDGCGGAENSFFHGSGRVVSGGQCLDMIGGVAFNGVQVGMFPCSNTSNQLWDFRL